MKIKIHKNKIKEGLNVVERISLKSNSLPILKNILFKADKNFLMLSSTDLEAGVKWWGLGKVESVGEIIIFPGTFSSIINFLPEEQISLFIEKGNLQIDCGDCKTQINGIISDDFPIIPSVKEEKFIKINSTDFCKGISQLVDIPVFSATRPEISGILFLFKGKTLKIVATDSYRLGEKTINLDSFVEDEVSFILSQKIAKEIINIFGDKNTEIKIIFGANQVLLESKMIETDHPEIQFISRLVDGNYPNYEDIIPSKKETGIIANRGEFLNQLKAAGVFSGRTNEIKIKVLPEKKGIEITAKSSEIGDYNSFLPVEIEGKKDEISFNFKYLIDGLTSIKSEKVLLELNGPSSPGVLRPLKGSDFLYIIMPIKND